MYKQHYTHTDYTLVIVLFALCVLVGLFVASGVLAPMFAKAGHDMHIIVACLNSLSCTH